GGRGGAAPLWARASGGPPSPPGPALGARGEGGGAAPPRPFPPRPSTRRTRPPRLRLSATSGPSSGRCWACRRVGAKGVSRMYVPAHFEETRQDVLGRLIHDHPLAALVTLGRDGLSANHIPLGLDPGPAPPGTLRGHVARANPVWRDFSRDVEALAIFQGPQAYISPAWYETKKETGKVVPTYNYIVVHAYGPLRVV